MTGVRRGRADSVALPDCFESHGFYHVDAGLPPFTASWLGFLGDVPAVGFYNCERHGVIAVSERGPQAGGNEAVLAAILTRMLQCGPRVFARLDRINGPDAELALLVEPRVAKGWYVGTRESLTALFGIDGSVEPARSPEPVRRTERVWLGAASFMVTPLERMTFAALTKYFAEQDRP